MSDLPDWITEYIEWEKSHGRDVTSERIEQLKQNGHVVILWYDESGKPQSRTFGTVPELSKQQTESIFGAFPFRLLKAEARKLGLEFPDDISEQDFLAKFSDCDLTFDDPGAP